MNVIGEPSFEYGRPTARLVNLVVASCKAVGRRC